MIFKTLSEQPDISICLSDALKRGKKKKPKSMARVSP